MYIDIDEIWFGIANEQINDILCVTRQWHSYTFVSE